MDGGILLNVRISAQCIQVFVDIVPNLAVSMLRGTLFFNGFLRRILFSERKVIPWHFHPVAISISPKISKSTNSTTTVVVTPTGNNLKIHIKVAENANSVPSGASSLLESSRWVSCNGYYIWLRYSHSKAQYIRKNSSTVVRRPWRDPDLTIAAVTYPFS